MVSVVGRRIHYIHLLIHPIINIVIVHTQPKYIAQLKKMAEKRKLEQEIIYERKVQRDIEKEGLESEDNEAYLTSAYRRKLEERKQMEEELEREEEIEGEW